VVYYSIHFVVATMLVTKAQIYQSSPAVVPPTNGMKKGVGFSTCHGLVQFHDQYLGGDFKHFLLGRALPLVGKGCRKLSPKNFFGNKQNHRWYK